MIVITCHTREMWNNIRHYSATAFKYFRWKDRKDPKIENKISNYDKFLKQLIEFLKSDSNSSRIVTIATTFAMLWITNWVLTKPFYVGSFSILCVLGKNAWCDYIWPEISLPEAQIKSANSFNVGEKLNNYLDDIRDNLLIFSTCLYQFRVSNSGMFCIFSTVSFLAVAGIGSILPGLCWAHIILSAVWILRLGLPYFGLELHQFKWCSPDFVDLVPELTQDSVITLEKAKDPKDCELPLRYSTLEYGLFSQSCLDFNQSVMGDLSREISDALLDRVEDCSFISESTSINEDFELISDDDLLID